MICYKREIPAALLLHFFQWKGSLPNDDECIKGIINIFYLLCIPNQNHIWWSFGSISNLHVTVQTIDHYYNMHIIYTQALVFSHNVDDTPGAAADSLEIHSLLLKWSWFGHIWWLGFELCATEQKQNWKASLFTQINTIKFNCCRRTDHTFWLIARFNIYQHSSRMRMLRLTDVPIKDSAQSESHQKSRSKRYIHTKSNGKVNLYGRDRSTWSERIHGKT